MEREMGKGTTINRERGQLAMACGERLVLPVLFSACVEVDWVHHLPFNTYSPVILHIGICSGGETLLPDDFSRAAQHPRVQVKIPIQLTRKPREDGTPSGERRSRLRKMTNSN